MKLFRKSLHPYSEKFEGIDLKDDANFNNNSVISRPDGHYIYQLHIMIINDYPEFLIKKKSPKPLLSCIKSKKKRHINRNKS